MAKSSCSCQQVGHTEQMSSHTLADAAPVARLSGLLHPHTFCDAQRCCCVPCCLAVCCGDDNAVRCACSCALVPAAVQHSRLLACCSACAGMSMHARTRTRCIVAMHCARMVCMSCWLRAVTRSWCAEHGWRERPPLMQAASPASKAVNAETMQQAMAPTGACEWHAMCVHVDVRVCCVAQQQQQQQVLRVFPGGIQSCGHAVVLLCVAAAALPVLLPACPPAAGQLLCRPAAHQGIQSFC